MTFHHTLKIIAKIGFSVHAATSARSESPEHPPQAAVPSGALRRPPKGALSRPFLQLLNVTLPSPVACQLITRYTVISILQSFLKPSPVLHQFSVSTQLRGLPPELSRLRPLGAGTAHNLDPAPRLPSPLVEAASAPCRPAAGTPRAPLQSWRCR